MKISLAFDSHYDLVDFVDEIAAKHLKPLPDATSITGEFRDAEIELAKNAYGATVQLDPEMERS